MTNAVNLASVAGNGFYARNRIINGAMEIDQRNAGASVTPSNGNYTLDRWGTWVSQASKLTIQRNAGAVTPPAGFINYLGVTSSSAYSVISSDYFGVWQGIEGFNVADLAWGTASAKTITVSFWVRSSLTGTFGGMIQNAAGNRGYTYSYSISNANTWEYKTVTIAGDTTGTWTTDNTRGLQLYFNLAAGSSNTGAAGSWGSTFYQAPTGAVSIVGTNGATFYLTGVQLEVGTVATPFERRLYPQEFAMCQRYYEVVDARWCTGVTYTANGDTRNNMPFKVNKRAIPTCTISGTAEVIAFGSVQDATNVLLGTMTVRPATYLTGISQISNNAAFTAAGGTVCWADNGAGGLSITASAEL